MKSKVYLIVLMFVSVWSLEAQNLHTDSNAASLTSEADAITGWTGNGVISSDSSEAQQGAFSIKLDYNSANSRIAQYTFSAVVGEEYAISIWAKEGAQSNDPAFANWTGFQNFNVTPITGTNWTQYTFILTVNNANPRIRIFSGSRNGGNAGDHIFFDSISIVPTSAGPDTEAPSAIVDLAASNTTDTTTDLAWTASTDNIGVTDYEVFQDGVSIGFTGGLTSFNVTGLTASTNYDFTVFARDAVPNISGVSNTANVTTTDGPDTEAPSAIVDLAASGTTDTATSLAWTASTDNVGVTDYEVFQDGVSIGFTGGVASMNVTGLTVSTSYDFTVFARDAIPNISGISNTINVTTLSDTEAPSAITDLVTSNTTDIATDLSWTASTDNVGVTDYEVFQDGVSIGFTGGTTSMNVTGLIASTSYDFTVFARDAIPNISAVSNTANATTTAGPDTEAPSAIVDLAASGTTDTATSLAWTASTDNVGVTDYEVFQDGVSIGFTGGTTSMNVTGLAISTSYDFTVFARDAVPNISAVSNTLSVTTLSDTEAPSAITDLAASNTTDTTTDLSWTASTDNVGVTNYEVFQDGVSIGFTGGTTSMNVTGLTASTSYDFTVFARDGVPNISGVSNTANVTTTAGPDTEAPSAIVDLAASSTADTSTSLAWTASTDNVGVTDYEVFQDGVSIGFTGGTTSMNVTGLTASTSYDFTVFARDAVPNVSGVSNTVNVTTSEAGTIVDYTSENANLTTIDWQSRDLFADGNVGIGTTNTQGYRLAVAGNVVAEEIKVALQTNWPDFVFEKSYNLPTLKEVEDYISKNGHLINIPSAKEVENSGIQLGEMNTKLLQKIEELTLYTIEQQKKIEKLETQNNQIKLLVDKLLKIEKQLEDKK